MAGPRGLGRGLDALIRQTNVEELASEARTVALDSIRANPWQPRTAFPDDSLTELAASIKSQGVLQPILVRPIPPEDGFFYELVAGERRLRAARMAGLTEIPAVVRELSDEQSLVIALIENLQRENLNPVDEAKGLARLREMLSLSQEDIAVRIGKSRAGVANALRLLQLPEEILADVAAGIVSAGHARAILALPEGPAMAELRDLIRDKGLSVREAEALAAYYKETGRFPEAKAEPESAKDRDDDEAGQPVAAKPVKPVDERLAEIEDKLREHLGAKVDVKGVFERGRIVIRFKGKEALHELVAKLTGETA
jgi:ParB family transcriptional regulator, chromosome partitioning protein